MAQRSILLLAALASGSAFAKTSSSESSAATSTMNLILPMLEDGSETLMGSIVGVDATATTFYLTCPTGESALTCGLGDGIELVEGDSVLEVHFTESGLG